MAVCGECRFWKEIGRNCYGMREGRCTADRERMFVLDVALNDVMPLEAGACPAFEENGEAEIEIEAIIKAAEEEIKSASG